MQIYLIVISVVQCQFVLVVVVVGCKHHKKLNEISTFDKKKVKNICQVYRWSCI